MSANKIDLQKINELTDRLEQFKNEWASYSAENDKYFSGGQNVLFAISVSVSFPGPNWLKVLMDFDTINLEIWGRRMPLNHNDMEFVKCYIKHNIFDFDVDKLMDDLENLFLQTNSEAREKYMAKQKEMVE